jgi:hypothetical protein
MQKENRRNLQMKYLGVFEQKETKTLYIHLTNKDEKEKKCISFRDGELTGVTLERVGEPVKPDEEMYSKLVSLCMGVLDKNATDKNKEEAEKVAEKYVQESLLEILSNVLQDDELFPDED